MQALQQHNHRCDTPAVSENRVLLQQQRQQRQQQQQRRARRTGGGSAAGPTSPLGATRPAAATRARSCPSVHVQHGTRGGARTNGGGARGRHLNEVSRLFPVHRRHRRGGGRDPERRRVPRAPRARSLGAVRISAHH
ncbi:unnamed protein product [Lampetra planeri]